MNLDRGAQACCKASIRTPLHINRNSVIASFLHERRNCISILSCLTEKPKSRIRSSPSILIFSNGKTKNRNKSSCLGPVCAKQDRDQDLDMGAEEFLSLEPTTPLENFFNRNSSLLESLEGNKMRSIIDMGLLSESPCAEILVVLGSQAFVNQLTQRCPEASIEVVHFSLDVLADIKAEYDDVRCFHIHTADFSEIEGSFDTVFLNYYPIFSSSLLKLLKSVTKHCKPGGTVTISLAQDRNKIHALGSQSGGVLQSSLPDKSEFHKVVAGLPFEVISFQDAPNFYIATLKKKLSTLYT